MRLKRITLLVLTILLALFFALQAFVKLTSLPAWVSGFRAWGYPEHFYLVVGAAELAGAVLLLVPKTRVYGAGLLMIVMLGAAVTHAVHRGPQFFVVVVIFGLLLSCAFATARLQRTAATPLT